MSSRSPNEIAPLPERVQVGRVLRAHGVRGELLVQPLSDAPGRFTAGDRLWLEPPGGRARRVAVAAVRRHAHGLLVRLTGLDDRERAAELAGASLEVDRRRTPPAPAGSYYYFELAGCRCSDRRAGDIGVVAEVVEDGGGLLLEIAGAGQRRLLVPFVSEFVEAVDVGRRRIELSLPPGLVESCTST